MKKSQRVVFDEAVEDLRTAVHGRKIDNLNRGGGGMFFEKDEVLIKEKTIKAFHLLDKLQGEL